MYTIQQPTFVRACQTGKKLKFNFKDGAQESTIAIKPTINFYYTYQKGTLKNPQRAHFFRGVQKVFLSPLFMHCPKRYKKF
jgi:hypothetical protein